MQTWLRGISVQESDVIIPIDIQNRLTQSIVALNAVALTIAGGATPNSTSSAITCDGFDNMSIVSVSSVANLGQIMIMWSFDNSTFTMNEVPSGDKVVNAGTQTTRVMTVPVRAPYCKVQFVNQDTTNAPTVTMDIYLKA